ncbi:MAG: phytanoyl-CoA dioxygenase family protein [Gammaproteobacteria bacterium]|nr:phytanoyl-CoA dioxygenase family protein [Gammaproteobacteria bacterium]MDH3536305.1 phytanoyl-CoA dioxygenase family protein [Gammaproteobacteria bacterium]
MQDYEIIPEQKDKLLGDGFTRLPDALSPELLRRWRDLADRFEAESLEAHARGEQIHGACVIDDPVGPRLMRADDILGRDTEAVLDLLACPALLAVARELCAPAGVPMQLDILYKHQHPHPIIMWHQGAPHPRGYPYLNVGVYLDDADADDGCLKYVPGTQHELQDICGLSEQHGWDIPGTVEQPARAGDILVQDMMILHGSAPKRSPGCRRTIYIEYRPVAGILESGTQSRQWAELRRRWMTLVARRAESHGLDTSWMDSLPSDLGSDADEAAAIVAHWEPPIPAFYCPKAIETETYPVPADMREESD